MKRLRFLLISVLLCVATPTARAQNTAVFPGRAATTQDLLTASNNFSTVLTAGISATATLLPVANTGGMQLPGVLSIGSEIIEVCSTSGSAFVVCASGRGFDHTSAVPASVGAVASGRIVGWHHNQVAAEVIALESAPTITPITSTGQLPGSCTILQIWLLTPAGTLYTCQNGVPGIAGSGAPTTLSWSTLTSGQWAALTSGQWSTLTP